MQLSSGNLIQRRGPLSMPSVFENYVRNAEHGQEIKLLAAARAKGTQQAHNRSLRHLDNYLHDIGSRLDRMTTKNLKFYLRLVFYFCFYKFKYVSLFLYFLYKFYTIVYFISKFILISFYFLILYGNFNLFFDIFSSSFFVFDNGYF